MKRNRALVGGAMLWAASVAGAQAPATIETKIPIRKIGATVRTSAITFGGVQHVRRLSDGRLLVNDPSRRQVLMLDSSLANPIVVIDSVGGRDNSYGMRAGGIVPYRADSTFFVDPTSSTLLLIDPTGKIAKVMSMPTSAVSYLTSPTSYGFPGYSEKLGIVFRMPSSGWRGPTQMPPEGAPEIVVKVEDSVAIVGMKLSTRRLDTLVKFGTGNVQTMRISYNNINSNSVNELYPVSDDWALAADGSIALLSGREYRLRWVNPDGTKSDSPRIPFAWVHNTDDEKARIVDSINKVREKNYQDRVEAQKKAAEAAAKGGTTPPAPGRPPVEFRPPPGPPRPITRPEMAEVTQIPDYFPAYERSSASMRADADTNIWIRPRPAKPVAGGPIYDILNRKGELIDRVQLPAGRTLIGFGPGGIVYLTMRDAGATRIEQVRYR
jgi:hypothetical protein